jgi:hypothetical protein
MGVSVPDEFRPEMAIAGEWQVTSERIVEPHDGEKKPDAIALGVRKRVLNEEELEAAETKKRRWGSAYRTYPSEEDNGDLDALLGNVTRQGRQPAAKVEAEDEMKQEVKDEPGASGVQLNIQPAISQGFEDQNASDIKKKPSDGENAISSTLSPSHASLKQEFDEPAAACVVFKKRKAKNIRQK